MINKIPYTSLILTFLLFLVSCSFSSQKAREILIQSQSKTYDAIIVPGVPFEEGKWSDVMKIRVYWSKYLYDKGMAKNIIYSGSAVYSPYYEAEIMALYAIELGIPKEHIFTEKKAEHSTENVYYSTKFGRNLGFKKIALATDTYQAKMLKRFISNTMNGEIDILPVVYDSLTVLSPTMYTPNIPFEKAFKEEFISITEREGFWKRLNGTWGNNIDTNAYNK